MRAPIRICIQVQVATSGPDSARACRHAQRRRPSARASRPSSKNCLCWAPRPARGPQPQAPQPTCVCRKKSQVTRRTHDRALASQLGRCKTCIIKTASSGTLRAACPPRPRAGRPPAAGHVRNPSLSQTQCCAKGARPKPRRAQDYIASHVTWQNHRPAARPRRAPRGGRGGCKHRARQPAPRQNQLPTNPPKAQDQSLSCAVAPGRRPCLHNSDAPAWRASGPAAATLLGCGRSAPPLRAHFVPATGQQRGRRGGRPSLPTGWHSRARSRVGARTKARACAPLILTVHPVPGGARAPRARARAHHAKSGAGRPAAAAAFIAATSSLVAKRPLMRGRTSA